jgi:hypothetical protein
MSLTLPEDLSSIGSGSSRESMSGGGRRSSRATGIGNGSMANDENRNPLPSNRQSLLILKPAAAGSEDKKKKIGVVANSLPFVSEIS